MSATHPTAAAGLRPRGRTPTSAAGPATRPEAIDHLAAELGLWDGTTVLDLAAGTGKLTRMLQATGATVIAVEPVAAMRRGARRGGAPESEVRDGTAEAIPAADGALDAVTVAQAFHWFDAGRALAEIHRIAAPRRRARPDLEHVRHLGRLGGGAAGARARLPPRRAAVRPSRRLARGARGVRPLRARDRARLRPRAGALDRPICWPGSAPRATSRRLPDADRDRLFARGPRARRRRCRARCACRTAPTRSSRTGADGRGGTRPGRIGVVPSGVSMHALSDAELVGRAREGSRGRCRRALLPPLAGCVAGGARGHRPPRHGRRRRPGRLRARLRRPAPVRPPAAVRAVAAPDRRQPLARPPAQRAPAGRARTRSTGSRASGATTPAMTGGCSRRWRGSRRSGGS